MDDHDDIWRLLEIASDGEVDVELFNNLKDRFHSVSRLRHTDPGALYLSSRAERTIPKILEFINDMVSETLLRAVIETEREDRRAAIRAYAVETFSRRGTASLVCFFFSGGTFAAVSQPNYGSLFQFTIYPRDIVSDALRADANEVFVAVNIPYKDRQLQNESYSALVALKEACEAMGITLAEPIFLSIANRSPEQKGGSTLRLAKEVGAAKSKKAPSN